MNTIYAIKIHDTNNELIEIEQKISELQNNFTANVTLIKALTNYALILAYGCIEYIVKNLISDYYSDASMPEKCKNFAYRLSSQKYPLLVKNESFSRFISKECSQQWQNEIKNRQNTNSVSIRNQNYKFNDLYSSLGATDSLTNLRNAFAHGENTYSGSITEIMQYFDKSCCWLYEIENIINTING